MIQKIWAWVKPFLPLVVTAAVVLCCAAAPVLSEIPGLLSAPDTGELDALQQQIADVQARQAEAEAAAEAPEVTPTEKANRKTENGTEAEAETLAVGVGDYEDGIYTGSGTGYGGSISVQVTVAGGQITDITILSAASETASFLSRAQGVISSILTAQTWEVDAVSGATYSSNGIKAAVKNALTGEVTASTLGSTANTGNSAALAQVSYEEPEGYRDGTYAGSATGFGGTISVQVVISGGEIVSITVTSAGGETTSYLSRATAVISRILAAQSPNVDTVSGATYSSSGIINATKKALKQAAASSDAEEGDETDEPDVPETPVEVQNSWTAVLPAKGSGVNNSYLSGSYYASAEGYGGPVSVSLKIAGGQITRVTVTSAEDETPLYLNHALAVLPRVIEAQSAGVDVVSGATFSSEGILNAVAIALADATYQEEPEPEPDPEPNPEPDPTPDPEPDPDEGDEEPAEPVVTTETSTESYSASSAVYPDEDEEFDPYTLTVTVTVTVTVKTTLADGVKTVETTRTITDVAISGASGSNARYAFKALSGMKAGLIAGGADVVSGATCSSVAIRSAYASAVSGIQLGTVTVTETED